MSINLEHNKSVFPRFKHHAIKHDTTLIEKFADLLFSMV